jgi:outer membrane protein assembly factor BamA
MPAKRDLVPRTRSARARRFVGLASIVTCAANLVVPAASAAEGKAEYPHTEFGIVPLVGGDTDYGIGFGELSSLARLAPGVKPYVWRLESGGFISFKVRENDGKRSLISPYQDVYVLLTITRFFHERLRLELRPSFTRETTQHYYGLGNASPAPPDDVPARDFYGRRHPTLSVRLRFRCVDRFFWELGTSYTDNSLTIDPASTLASDMTAGTPTVRSLLATPRRHGVLLIENSAVYDTRDNEISTTRGLFLQLKFRYSPRAGDYIPYRYAQIDLNNRYFFTLVPRYLVVAARTVVDLQLGDVPFYELARYEDTFALGGGNGVRGIPGQRYYGRAKAFANLELRSRLFGFELFGKDLMIATAVFADVGRLWATVTSSHPELDGSGLGLKYGLGGGLRVQGGETFVVRLDLAWSPDARPIGAYLTAGEEF